MPFGRRRARGLALVRMAASGQVHHPAGDVDGVVAEPLVEAGHRGQIHGYGQAHLSGGQFGDQRGVQTVQVDVAIGECVYGGAVALYQAPAA